PSCQIFRRYRSGVKVTLRRIGSRGPVEGGGRQKAIPSERLPSGMATNVASLPITVGVGAFLVRQDKLLVVRKTYGPAKGQWTIPSGYVEPRESIIQTIERELKEETNIVGRDGPLLAVRNRVNAAAKVPFLIFRMAYGSGPHVPARTEVRAAAFVPLSHLARSKGSA